MAIDSYRVSWKAYGAKNWTRITEFCSGLRLSMDYQSTTTELNFTYPHGEKCSGTVEELKLKPADQIIVRNTATNKKIFDGIIIKTEFGGTVTCKDHGFYMKNPIYLKATKKRIDAILKSICSKAGVKYSGDKITSKTTVSFAQKSAEDCVQDVMDKLRSATNRRHWAHFVDKKLTITPFDKKAQTIKVQRNPDWGTFDCTSALSAVSGSISMENYINTVYAITNESNKTKARAKAVYKDGVNKYGKLVEYKEASSKSTAASTAKKALTTDAQLTRDFKCTVYASDKLTPGVRLKFDGTESIDIKGEFWITAVDHELTHPHTATLTLKRVTRDYVKADVSEMNTTLAVNQSSGGSSSGGGGTTTVYTGKTVPALYTAYYPYGSRLEGGYYDARDNPLISTYLDKGILECAAPKQIALGKKIQVKNTGTSKDGKVYLCMDRGGAINVVNGVYHFDLLMRTGAQCSAWGRRTGKALIISGTRVTENGGGGISATRQKILRYAVSKLGQNLSPGFAWCAWFVVKCCRYAGVGANTVPTDYSVVGMRSFAQRHGRYHTKGSGYKPKPGDIFIELSNGKSHTGFVYSVSSNGYNYVTVEGNASNRVRKHSRSLGYSCLSGFFSPNY